MGSKVALTAAGVFLAATSAFAQPTIDLRADGPIGNEAAAARFVLSISDCTDVTQVDCSAGSLRTILVPADSRRVPGSSVACEYPFRGEGADHLSAAVTISLRDGSTLNFSEAFVAESTSPTLSLVGLGVDLIDGVQHLRVSVLANDDTDISYVGVDLVGMRASALRAAGGVVDRARQTAFARTQGELRVYPRSEGQSEYSILVPFSTALDAAAVATDGVVILSLVAVDASGNQIALSKTAFTGEGISEAVLGLSVEPQSVVFTSLIETTSLVPVIDFQFRGATPLPGPGTGVQYSSSDPNRVAVDAGGVVFPVAPTGAQEVTITVSYPGAAPVAVAVRVDPSRTVVSLSATNLAADGTFRLPRLNALTMFPPLQANFDDGSAVTLGDQFALTYVRGAGSTGILDIDTQGRLNAHAAISAAAPVLVTVTLRDHPTVQGVVPISAIDALPQINLELPPIVTVGEAMALTATVDDDVGVTEVQFLLDGQVVGTQTTSPYGVTLDIPEGMANRILHLTARATDTKGQVTTTPEATVTVAPKVVAELPPMSWDSPKHLQRVVGGSPVAFQLAFDLGPAEDPGVSRITYVHFFLDGRRVGEAYFPIIEFRQQASPEGVPEDHLFELWRADAVLPTVSVETSAAFSATVYDQLGGSKEVPSGLLRVVTNAPPQVRLLAPEDGSVAVVGETLRVDVEVRDDFLAAGTAIELLANNRVVKTLKFQDPAMALTAGTAGLQSTTQTFNLFIDPELLGATLELKATAVDALNAMSESGRVRLTVRADQTPQVALLSPAEGASLTSGLSVELRADATDDRQVARVEFYVNGQLVGTDVTAPYAVAYDTPEGVSQAQALVLQAAAYDSKGQVTRSSETRVTLGPDTQAPVINLASPAITGTEAGESLAAVTEDSDIVLKGAGYDNVLVTQLFLRGVARQGTGFVLTGNPLDVLSGVDFAPQQIPGTVKAFSASRIVHVPLATGLAGGDRYPIEIEARDGVGNRSTARVTIVIRGDADPAIVRAQTARASYLPRDVVQLDVQVSDDQAVRSILAEFYVGGATTPTQTVTHDATTGLLPQPTVIDRFEFDLGPLGLANAAQSVRVDIIATDNKGHRSNDHIATFSTNVTVSADLAGPLVSVLTPVPGSTLYHGGLASVSYEVSDGSPLASAQILVGGTVVHSATVNGRSATGAFNYTLPSSGVDLSLELRAADVLGNSRSATYAYLLRTDQPPVVTLRSPPPGTRLAEGARFTLVAAATDNRALGSVQFFVEQGGATLQSQVMTGAAATAAQASGGYLSANLRMPHKPEGAEPPVRVGVRATDDGGLVTEVLAQLEGIDDVAPPNLVMETPSEPLFVMPGEVVTITGGADDDFYTGDVTAVLVNGAEEIPLTWDAMSRSERVQQITIPNPVTFGSIVVGERVFLTFSARFTVPRSLEARANEEFMLELRIADLGYNAVATLGLPLTILADEAPPTIRIASPAKVAYDRQVLPISIDITDNLGIASYNLSVVGVATPLRQGSGLDVPRVSITGLNLDLAPYSPIPAEGKSVTLSTTASDGAGNDAEVLHTIRVMPDAPPLLSVSDHFPERPVIGGRLFHVMKVTDDAVAADAPVQFLPAYTSLSGLGTARQVKGRRVPQGASQQALIALTYPEATGTTGAIRLGSAAYVDFSGGELVLHPLPGLSGDLVIDLGAGIRVGYHVDTYKDDACTALVDRRDIAVGGALSLGSILGSGVAAAIVTPRFETTAGAPVTTFVKGLQIHTGSLAKTTSYTASSKQIAISARPEVLVLLADAAASTTAFVAAAEQQSTTDTTSSRGLVQVVPPHVEVTSVALLGHALDRLSSERGEVALSVLATRAVGTDDALPQIVVTSPSNGQALVPLQHLVFEIDVTDDAGGVRSVQLASEGNVVRELAGAYGQSHFSIPYDVPEALASADLDVTVTATDPAGHASSTLLRFPVQPNAPAEIALREFATYKVGGTYQKILNTPDRVNYGEFWVRIGETFRLTSELFDDAGLTRYAINRLDRLGNRVLLAERLYGATCPALPAVHDLQAIEVTFDQVEPTEYEVVAVDNAGHTTARTILIHPLANMAPSVRIVTPAAGQIIVGGLFAIKVGVAMTDDRLLNSGALEVYANGTLLSRLTTEVFSSQQELGGLGALTQAFASMYDEIEQAYGVDLANDYGRRGTANAQEIGFLMHMPPSLTGGAQALELSAVIRDIDGAIGRNEITLQVAPDTVNPEVAVLRPGPGFGVTEAANFTVDVRAYDNVKVEEVAVYAAYGMRPASGPYLNTAYDLPLRSFTGIADRDFEPITTVNIDTPVFTQLIPVGRLAELTALFGVSAVGATFDRWIKVVARDAAGNVVSREVSFPVRIDERPSVIVIDPLPDAQVVEGAPLAVNVDAFDDVGISSLRLTATHGALGTVVFDRLLNAPPYTFQLSVPAFAGAPNEDVLILEVEAIDTYGAAFGDVDQHRALETVTLEIVIDEPPMVAIARPLQESEVIEGQNVLVQLTAIDDIGLDKVSLQVQGLFGGDKSFTDVVYPYEFVFAVPFGQSPKDLTLTANATELRYAGTPRTVQAAVPITLHIQKDVTAPDMTVQQPLATGATVVEKRDLPFALQATDNVGVSTVRVELFVDGNQDGTFAIGELANQKVLLGSPYSGSLKLASLATYSSNAVGLEFLNGSLVVTARDGTGNSTIVTRPVRVERNRPPEVIDIQILDQRGFSLGPTVSSITEGRDIIVAVVANDPEVGVDTVRLYKSLILAGGAAGDEALVGEDGAAPFQFALRVPSNQAGGTLRFRGEATDLDGFLSLPGSARELTIAADLPPTAEIEKPASDASVVIEGQEIEVVVAVIDDLGPAGVDRVLFYMNDEAVYTTHTSVSEESGAAAQEHVYRALLQPPPGAQGVVLYAIAFDVMGHSARTGTVRVGSIEDTVAPDLDVLTPLAGELLTTGERVRVVAQVRDIGVDAGRTVAMRWLREAQDNAGVWQLKAEATLPLVRDDSRAPGDATPVSDPEQNSYVYWADFLDGAVLRRGDATGVVPARERVRVVTTVATPNHIVTSETAHEVGPQLSERRYLLPEAPPPTGATAGQQALASSVYYGAVDQFQSSVRTGGMLGAWSNFDPMRVEQGLGNLLEDEMEHPEGHPSVPRTGIFILDQTDEQGLTDGSGRRYVYSPLLAGASDIFAGTITELHADADFVLASKTGSLVPEPAGSGGAFAASLEQAVQNGVGASALHYENNGGELLVFAVQDGEGQFGLPYRLTGRIDMPFPDVYGVARKDDLAFVANGNGGVQVIDISNLAAPYHVGFIKPNGFARDVAVGERFAFIAASQEGVVIADVTSPALPIVAHLDTLGVANRLQLVGKRLFVTDMSGEGGASALNILDVSDPYNPRMLDVVELHPARRDLVADGTYSVTVAGNQAYVTVMYSDQTDAPAQSVVEIINLPQTGDPKVDATVPVVVQRQATSEDFAARGLVVARGGVQVAAGQGGFARIEVSELSILANEPLADAEHVSTQLATIRLELSAALPASTTLTDYFRVHEDHPQIGRDVTSQFALQFGTRAAQPANDIVELVRVAGQDLAGDKRYYVVVSAGLSPVTGLPLRSDFVFSFTTAKGALGGPDIVAIAPAYGSIAGGAEVVLSGSGFGSQPKVFFGGQRVMVTAVEAPGAGQPFERVTVTTAPNQAGPAAVELVNDEGLADVVLGGFTYVDLLAISFITPPVVRVSQSGAGDVVSIVGFGFHDGVELLAYKSGDPSSAVSYEIGEAALQLYSSERARWTVPDFGASYRGFVDVEISDDEGRRFVLPNALFYGRLNVDRRLAATAPLTRDEIDSLLANDSIYVPDPLRFPPGELVDVASDPALGLVYVLGTGVQKAGSPGGVLSDTDFRHYMAPGWISLVRYDRANLGAAAPMHGFGYFDLPQDLTPTDMLLTERQLYIAAEGADFPFIDTQYEGRRWLLVYDRENELPGTGGGVRDRDILFALPLPFSKPITSLVAVDDLLLAANPSEGVAVLSISDPLHPSVVRTLRQGLVAGERVTLAPSQLFIADGVLHVVGTGPALSYDLSRPTLPQLGAATLTSPSALLSPGQRLVSSRAPESEAVLFDVSRPANVRELGRYDGHGFVVPGKTSQVVGATTTAGNLNNEEVPCGDKKLTDVYLGLYDLGRLDGLTILDALRLKSCSATSLRDALLTDDGIVVAAVGDELMLTDTLVLDLVRSVPAQGAQGVPLNSAITLVFNRAIDVPANEDPSAYVAQYVALVREDGSALGVPVVADVEVQVDDSVTVTPQTSLLPNERYALVLTSVLGTRRTEGLLDHRVTFQTGSNDDPPPQVLAVMPTSAQTTGGQVEVTVRDPSNPVFTIGGAPAPVLSSTPVDASWDPLESTCRHASLSIL